MKRIFDRIAAHASRQPEKVALRDNAVALTYGELPGAIAACADRLQGQRVAFLLDNSCAWAVVDLALMQRATAAIPVPTFFSDEQVRHLVADAEPELIVTDQPARPESLLHLSPSARIEVAGRELALFTLPLVPSRELPAETAKVTYTSGTTGDPKGVCLRGEAIARVAIGLAEAVDATEHDRSLSVLPLSTLLENLGGIYAPLYSGGTAALPDLASIGFEGSSKVSPEKLLTAFHRFAPTTTILVPQLLTLLVAAAGHGATLPASLRFMAVGGAPCPSEVLQQARQLGLPVYQGYGLSEAASVVALNRPGEEREGSVGRPLPHVAVTISEEGEVVVAGHLFSGYLGGAPLEKVVWMTGDLGHFDEEGFLYITGRRKTAFATAYGRNIAPEWVESELTANPVLRQAVLIGEARPFNVAMVVPHPSAKPAQVSAAIAAANARLPDYARITCWLVADAPFTHANGLAHRSGAPDRKAIEQRYAALIDNFYTGEQQHVAL